MNILYITEDHSVENYGVTTMLSQLANELVRQHGDSRVVIAATGANPVPQHNNIVIESLPPAGLGRAWRWSPDLLGSIKRIIHQHKVNLIHIHGVWSAGPWCGLTAARQLRIPAVVSTHGMWEQWFWRHDNLLKISKKKLYFHLMLKPAIRRSMIIHALNSNEAQDVRCLLPHNGVCIIPNAILAGRNFSISTQPEKTILFLGRLHPKKGVELLIRAFAQAQLGGLWKLVIAGPEENQAYARKLKNEAVRTGLLNQIQFMGPIFGDRKMALIRRAWVQVLPTYSEGQAMINLETAVCGVPSITTRHAGLENWQDGGGLLIEPNSDALADSLLQVCRWTLAERNRRGRQLRQWVTQKYSLEAVIPQWEKLYETLESSGGL